MPVIAGVRYFSAAEIAKDLQLSRQTLWRWRTDGKIPPGHRYRDKQLLFTQSEVEAIREFSHRIEPVEKKHATESVERPT